MAQEIPLYSDKVILVDDDAFAYSELDDSTQNSYAVRDWFSNIFGATRRRCLLSNNVSSSRGCGKESAHGAWLALSKPKKFLKTYRALVLCVLFTFTVVILTLLRIGSMLHEKIPTDFILSGHNIDVSSTYSETADFKNFDQWSELDFVHNFNQFIIKHGKKYASHEDAVIRFKLFQENLRFIYDHNSKDSNHRVSMNQFGDMHPDEFAKFFGRHQKMIRDNTFELNLEVEPNTLPKDLDWRSKSCVNPIKDQKACGSCWAFGVVGALESAYCIKHGQLLSFSEQELVDCDTSSNGCSGGTAENAIHYIKNSGGGICSEDSYPYLASDSSCGRKKCNTIQLNLKGYTIIQNNPNTVQQVLAQYGPLAIVINANARPFMFYKSGIYKGKCGAFPDHEVLLVGYGVDEQSGTSFWTIRNSWGRQWGEDGYLRLIKDGEPNGHCGILRDAILPRLE